MALGDALKKRIEELAQRQSMIERSISALMGAATVRAVEEAVDRTAPNDGILRGVNMISGELAQHWESDSEVVPKRVGNTYTTALANDKEYASYVNDGHTLEKRFVPGLYIDENGLLSRDLERKKGLMVGTKTKYVEGRYMKEAASDKYQEVMEAELPKLSKELFK